MKVFISWSGHDSTSHKVGSALDKWLPLLFENIEIFFSSTDLSTGSLWTHDLLRHLEESQFGIICATERLMNQRSPWMFFETGALAKKILKQPKRSRVIPLMIDISAAQLLPPLNTFQAIPANRDGIWQLVKTLADSSGPNRENLRERFNALWQILEPQIESALAADASGSRNGKISTDDLLVRLIERVQYLETSVADLIAQVHSLRSIFGARDTE
ncbi:MAG TPA: TIR domain-containing protein [Thermoanaerobaculia bacterium]|nr:TIR domain-containing protein [Thermoanaerobaculia bacterium]